MAITSIPQRIRTGLGIPFLKVSSKSHALNPPRDLLDQQLALESLLQELLAINSQTNNLDGVEKAQHIVARELKSIGFVCEFIKNPDPNVASGELLIATLPGEQTKSVVFVAHSDTVIGPDQAGIWQRLESGKARGAGIIDNKGGLVVALGGLKKFVEELRNQNKLFPFTLKFVCSPNEESGSTGFHDIFRRLAQDAVLVLGFEPALDDGSIIDSRRGNRWYHIVISGEEAHAGRCKGEELNAAHEAAMKISQLLKLRNLKKGLSLNVARMEGGRDRFNVVCGQMQIKLDVRFANFASRDRLVAKIEKILNKPSLRSPITGRTCATTYTIEDDCPPFSSTLSSRRLLKTYLRAVEKTEGRKVVSQRAGGAGDVNFMSRPSTIVLDGLGPIGGGMHTENEFLWTASLSTRSAALSAFLLDVGKRRKKL